MMLGGQRRPKARRSGIALGLLSIALASEAISGVSAQTATESPAAPSTPEPGAVNGAAGGMAEGAAVEQGQALGRPFGSSFTAVINLSETYDTNPLGLAGYGVANSGADFLTTLSLSLGAHDHTRRFTGDLQYTLVGDAFVHDSAYDQLYNYLSALANIALIPDYLSVRANAFASPILVNGLGPLAAAGLPVASGANTGLYNAYGYSVSPVLTFRLGSFARSDSLVGDSSIFFVQPSGPTVNQVIPGQTLPTQLVTYSALERLSSGSDFDRLNWRLTATGSKTIETGIDFQEWSGIADIKYAITRQIALISTLGYESFTTNQILTSTVSGPIELGGLQVSFGPRIEIDARAGQQFNFPSYLANIHYELNTFTTFDASLTDSVTTSAASILGGLDQLGTNNQGDFYNTNYQLNPNTPPANISAISAFNPSPIDNSAINNILAHERAALGSLIHIADRTQYRLTGFWTVYDALTAVPSISARQTSTGGEFAALRNINLQLAGILAVDYANQQILGSNYSLISGSVALSYTLTPKMQVYFRAAYARRLSSAGLIAVSPLSGSFSDTALTIGVSRQL